MEFDDEHPDFERILGSLTRHSAAGPSPGREWLAEGLIARGELAAIYGAPGQTKSVLALDFACRMAAGMHWDGSELPGRYTVLYVAAERPAQVRRRVDAFCAHHRIPPLEDLLIYDGSLDLAGEVDELDRIIRVATLTCDAYRPDLVVIDTLAAAMSKPTSDTVATATAAHALVNAIRPSMDGTSAVLIVHHTPLGDPSRMSGGHITAAVDVAIIVKKTKGGSIARVTKNNGAAEPWPTLTYGLQSVDVPCAGGETASEPVVIPGATEADDVDIFTPALKGHRLQALTALQALTSASVDEWREKFRSLLEPGTAASASKVAFNRARSWLVENGHVINDGDKWLPAQQGGEHFQEQEQSS